LTKADTHRRSPLLAKMEGSVAIKLAGATYDLGKGRLAFGA